MRLSTSAGWETVSARVNPRKPSDGDWEARSRKVEESRPNASL